MTEEQAHITVMLEEAVVATVTKPDGVYVDGTFGRGGHSRRLLESLNADGRLFGFDKDVRAVEAGKALMAEDSRFVMIHDSFASLAEQVESGVIPAEIDGVLLDLGVSSPQLDDAERGFSFMNDGPLDMRMDQTRGISIAEWLTKVSAEDLATALKEYGEERYAKRIARAILEEQEKDPITRTLRLAEIVKLANPAWEKHKHPATRAFQGMRIFINRELDDLRDVLDRIVPTLVKGGRMVVISFHSLEDRMVKRFIRRQAKGPDLPAGLPIREADIEKSMKPIGKAVKPSAAEVDGNPRSRSAIMRVAEKL